MEMKVFAISKQVTGNENFVNIIKNIGGKAGGTCYSSKKFFESLAVEPEKKSKARYDMIVNTGHNIGNHTQVTIVLDGISKMMAIILNSFKFYNTSERSGRYTDVSNGNPLYSKWKDILIELIGESYPELAKNDPKRVEKLAMENARYFLPIFQKSTTMVYTTGTMELNYICRWFEKFCKKHSHAYMGSDLDKSTIEFLDIKDMSYFYSNIFVEMKQFINVVKENGLYINGSGHGDNKNREMELFENRLFYNLDPRNTESSYCTLLDRMYNIEQAMTFPAFADLMRHRTYSSTIISMTNKFGAAKFYVPKIIREHGRINEWLNDMNSLDYIAQGRLITVRECGNLDKFVLKAKERLCGRVQLEVLNVTYESTRKLARQAMLQNMKYSFTIDNPQKTYLPYAINILSDIFDFEKHEVKSKCQILGECKEPCFFGLAKCFNRKI